MMNKIIKELADKAYKENGGFLINQGGAGDGIQNYRNFIEKFAELIIAECMAVGNMPNSADGKYDEFLPSQMIAKHFWERSGTGPGPGEICNYCGVPSGNAHKDNCIWKTEIRYDN